MASSLDNLLQAAALAPQPDLGLLHITGPDAARWLNGMVTASVQSLAIGDAAYTFFLNAQGRILGDATLARTADERFVLLSDAAQLPVLQAHLEHFIIMDDVELQAPMADTAFLLVTGPAAADRLLNLDIAAPTHPLQCADGSFDAQPLLLLSLHAPIVSRIVLCGGGSAIAAVQQALAAAGVTEASIDDLEALRLLEQRPAYGIDITARELPQETAQPHALHFSKGCYLGQEIVERIRSRGQVHRGLTSFTLDGPPPQRMPSALWTGPADSPVEVGQLTSAVPVERDGAVSVLALGIVRRDALQRADDLRYSGGAVRVLPPVNHP